MLHCPHIVGGNAQNLARMERKLGLNSWSVAYLQNYLNYPIDEILCARESSLFSQQVQAWLLLFRAWFKFDIIHYNFGSSILPWTFNEHWIGKSSFKKIIYSLYTDICHFIETNVLSSKVIVVTYQGDDARQGEYCREQFAVSIAQEVESNYYSLSSDRLKRKKIKWFSKYADIIYALNPDIVNVLPNTTKFLPYCHINIDRWIPKENNHYNKKPLVIHAPSHRGVKGTRFIIDAVNRLKNEGIEFDFQLIENLSNQEAKQLYENADLVIDQLLAGWYGGFAVEAMALAKPVICYIREEDLHILPNEMRMAIPIINAEPKTIYYILKKYLSCHRNQLIEIGNQSRRYVERWHSPTIIASQVIADYYHVWNLRNN